MMHLHSKGLHMRHSFLGAALISEHVSRPLLSASSYQIINRDSKRNEVQSSEETIISLRSEGERWDLKSGQFSAPDSS